MRSPKQIRSEILKTEEKLKKLREQLFKAHMREAVKEVSKWRPDLRLMLGPPPKRVT